MKSYLRHMKCSSLISSFAMRFLSGKGSDPGEMDFSFSETTDTLKGEVWRTLSENAPAYLQPEFLMASRNTLEDELEHRYVVFHKDDKPVGIAVFHLIVVQTEQPVKRLREKYPVLNSAVVALSGGDKNYDFRLLICGSPFTTGDFGYHFVSGIAQQDKITAIRKASELLRKREYNEISAVLIKDFYPRDDEWGKGFEKDGFTRFAVEPNMVMPILPQWNSLDDYLASLKSKYRTKANAAIRRSAEIEIHQMDESEIEQHGEEIKSLYGQVKSRASFGIGHFRLSTFSRLAAAYPQTYRFLGYFLEGKLVAFQTAWLHKEALEAHFVGIDYDKNYRYAIYQRMLYEYIRFAIANHNSRVIFGRSAMEIKSTVGAIPIDSFCYIRHKSTSLNKFLSFIFKHVTPSPFKRHFPFKVKLAENIEATSKMYYEND